MKKILMTLTLAFAAMIAIPTAAIAQDSKPEQKKECCKKENCNDCKKEDCKKEDCKKENCKDCKKECSKPCSKDGKDIKMKRVHSGKLMVGEGRRKNPSKDEKMRKAHRENLMFKGITLSNEQKDKIKVLREKNLSAEKKAKAELKAKSNEEMQKLREEYDKEVEKVLDKEQLKQYQTNKAEMEARRVAKEKKSDK